MKQSDLKFLFDTGFVDFKAGKAGKAKCGLYPGVWEPCDVEKDGVVGSKRSGWMKKDGVFRDGVFMKTHRRFGDDVDVFFSRDGSSCAVKLEDVREPAFPRFLSHVANFLRKAMPWAVITVLGFMVFGMVMFSMERKAEVKKLVSRGWTHFEGGGKRAEWELLEREKARNEFGDERGKYVFHVMETQYGSVLYRAHSLTNSCEACGKEPAK